MISRLALAGPRVAMIFVWRMVAVRCSLLAVRGSRLAARGGRA